MATISRGSLTATAGFLTEKSSSFYRSPRVFYYPRRLLPRVCALKTSPDGRGVGSGEEEHGRDLLRKPVVSRLDDKADGEGESCGSNSRSQLVDWEDEILSETMPLVGFVRMILHSGKYKAGDRLSCQHGKTILERLLPHHPEYEKKIGCGVNYIMVGYHPDFPDTRCLLIVRKDGEVVDFSYWRCVKGMIRKKYPLYADSFIIRHFPQHKGS